MILTNNYLEKLGPHELSDLAEFIVAENLNHHGAITPPEEFRTMVKSIYRAESKYYDNSEIFVARDYIGFIIGSIRVLKWNYIDALPIQNIFGINPLSAVKNWNNIFHIGRFAIKQEIRDIRLLKQLMVCAIAPVCEDEGNVAFAECDSKLFRILNLLGIEIKALGKPVNYLGSETIPIIISYHGMIKFYEENKHLITDAAMAEPKVSLIHQTVVSDYYQHYYSFV